MSRIPPWPGLLAAVLSAVLTATIAAQGPPAQPPQFKSGVELVAVDVQVVAGDGEPVLGLSAGDFDVRIDGRPRRVASVQLLEQTARGRFIEARRVPGDDPGGTGAGRAAQGRIVILAIDENSFWTGHARAVNEATRLFIDRLSAEDLLGLVTLPGTGPQVAPTREHHLVRDALDRVVGLRSTPSAGLARLTTSEVFDITAGDGETLQRVVARECLPTDSACRKRIQMDAVMLAQEIGTRGLQSIGALRGVFSTLADVPGRKTVVLVSAGLAVSDRSGGAADIQSETRAVGRAAAAANTTLYVLQMDTGFLDSFSASAGRTLPGHMRDTSTFASGLNMLAGAAGGEHFRISNSADNAFDRVLRETSAYYLLGIEPLENDRDGKPHRVAVAVSRRGTTVRARATIVIPARR